MTEFDADKAATKEPEEKIFAGTVVQSDELAEKLLEIVIDRVHDAKDCKEFRIKYATDTLIKTIPQMEDVMAAVGMSDECIVAHMTEKEMNPIGVLIDMEETSALDLVIGLALACAEMCPTCKIKEEGPLKLLHKSTLGRLLKEKGESIQ
jgi:hypothetical protein